MRKSTPLLLIALLPLSGCVTGRSEAVVTTACPTAKQYTDTQLDRAADELDALPADSVVGGMVVDYGQLRQKLRKCSE